MSRLITKAFLLSAFFRRRCDLRRLEPPLVTLDNLTECLAELPSSGPITDRFDLALETLKTLTPFPGALPALHHNNLDIDSPLFLSAGMEETRFLLDELVHRGWTERLIGGQYRIIGLGYERLEEMQRSAPQRSTKAFVAMSFDRSRDEIFRNGIEPAVTRAGYDPKRVDRVEHVNRIDDEIMGLLRQSRFAVADFTGQRNGVYFETGFMLGLERRVYWLCDKREMAQLHFDARQYNFIDYESADDLRRRLYQRIMALEGPGPLWKEPPHPTDWGANT